MSDDAREREERFEDDGEVEEVLRRFESCECPPDDFRHRQHLTVALCYVLESGWEEACRRVREGIHRFLAHHGVDPHVYHETITLFWMWRVRGFVAHAGADRPVFELANELAASCGDARLVFDYYSKQLIESDEARAGWVEPDLKPLDF